MAGSTELELRDAYALAIVYPRRTLREYDVRASRPPRSWRSFTESDVDAVRVIERRAFQDQVATAVLSADLPWCATPQGGIDIADLRPHGKEYGELCAFWSALKEVDGVGDAVASKLMYLKWPRATIILDSLVRNLYATYATDVCTEIREAGSVIPEADGWSRFYTFAFQRDVAENRRRGTFDGLRELLRDAHPDVGPGPELADLPDPRLLDIVAWQLARRSS